MRSFITCRLLQMKSRYMRWAEYVVGMGEMGNTKFLLERDHSEDLNLDGKVILEWISGKQFGGLWQVVD
jgi:hypothetical protein